MKAGAKSVQKDVRLSGFSTESTEPKVRVQSAFRAISILLAVSESPNGLKIKEIAERLGLSRQVTYHLFHTLLATGIIRKNENNRYVLGLAAVSIAEGFHRQLAPPELLARKVRSIVAATNETAYASGWVGGEIVALATEQGQSPVGAARVPQGFSGYAHARATGKLLLALADPSITEAYLNSHPMEPRTDHTITTREELTRELERIRMRKYAIDNEEFHEGIRCLAVPVEGLGGRFALGISVPSGRFQINFDKYLDVLLDSARISN
jgi:IclR family acetate operon transcriptional repressor